MHRAALLMLMAGACVETGPGRSPVPPPLPEGPWLGVETRLLADDLVGFVVSMAGEPSREALSGYADCAVAQYATIRGFGFARQIRTTYAEEGGIHRADAVYTVSKAFAEGLKTIDAEVKLADCRDRGIPTI